MYIYVYVKRFFFLELNESMLVCKDLMLEVGEVVSKKKVNIYMGWLRLVGSIKLQVSFAEYSLFYRVLSQKRPIISSILLTEATPYLYAENADLFYMPIYICMCMC